MTALGLTLGSFWAVATATPTATTTSTTTTMGATVGVHNRRSGRAVRSMATVKLQTTQAGIGATQLVLETVATSKNPKGTRTIPGRTMLVLPKGIAPISGVTAKVVMRATNFLAAVAEQKDKTPELLTWDAQKLLCSAEVLCLTRNKSTVKSCRTIVIMWVIPLSNTEEAPKPVSYCLVRTKCSL